MLGRMKTIRSEIRMFLRSHYDDNHLGRLRRACQKQRVVFSNPNLCLLGRSNEKYDAHTGDGQAKFAERLFHEIGHDDEFFSGIPADVKRNKELLVLVEQEMMRRCRARRKEEIAA